MRVRNLRGFANQIFTVALGIGGLGSFMLPLAVAGSEDSPVRTDCLWLSPNGNDQNAGMSPDRPLRTAAAVLGKATPGMHIRLLAGTYPPLKFVGLRGAKEAPITLEPAEDAVDSVTLTTQRQDGGIGLELEKCEHVIVQGIRIANSQKGIDVQSCTHCIIRDNTIENLGQEGIHVGRLHTWDGSEKFLAPASGDVQVIGNRIMGTGKHAAVYGEGIYIGTGAFRGDDTHDVVVEGNVLSDISAEGIEVKAGATAVVIRGNLISDTHHEYNAAITVSVEGSSGPSGKYVIENNRIWNIRKIKHSVAGIAIGHGDAVIRNNLIWNIEGGIGIRVYETFSNPRALNVIIERNTVVAGGPGESILLHSGTGGAEPSRLKARVRLQANLTDDGSAGSLRVRFGPASKRESRRRFPPNRSCRGPSEVEVSQHRRHGSAHGACS
jgi:hypothetical protein